MKLIRVIIALALAFTVVACSSEKKVGSGIDIQSLSEKGKALGEAVKKNEKKGGPVVLGQTDPNAAAKKQQTQQANAAAAAQAQKAKAQEEQAAVNVAITASGYDPYVIRVFKGGVITVTNRYTKPASFTADRGEFDSGELNPGESWTFHPQTVGTFNFHDSKRNYVVGQLEVLAT